MKNIVLIFLITLIISVPIFADAHQDGCHRWHSCPSDSGSYTCGDTGNCSECNDNAYCKDRQVRGYESVKSFEPIQTSNEDSLRASDYGRIAVVVVFLIIIFIVIIGWITKSKSNS